jgi:hypothetical protein
VNNTGITDSTAGKNVFKIQLKILPITLKFWKKYLNSCKIKLFKNLYSSKIMQVTHCNKYNNFIFLIKNIYFKSICQSMMFTSNSNILVSFRSIASNRAVAVQSTQYKKLSSYNTSYMHKWKNFGKINSKFKWQTRIKKFAWKKFISLLVKKCKLHKI